MVLPPACNGVSHADSAFPLAFHGVVPADGGFPPAFSGVVPADIGLLLTVSEVSAVASVPLPKEPPPPEESKEW